MLFYNLGGGPHRSGDSFAFTEGGLSHAVHSFSPLARDYDVKVVCPNVPKQVAGRRFDVDGVTVDCPSPPGAARWMWSEEFSFTERRLHTFCRIPALLASYSRLRRDLSSARPHVILANGVLGSYLAGRNRSIAPVIGVIHHLYQDAWTRGSKETTHGFTAAAEKWLLNHMRVDAVAAVNPAVCERLAEQGFDTANIELVGNGVDLRPYPLEDESRSPDLIFVGRFRRDKRIDVLIEAMALIHRERPDTVLHIVGDGLQRASLQRLAGRRGVDGVVRFHGFVDERRKVQLLRSCSIYLSASRFEGFGIPVVEAMAAGAVPVVSDIPAHRFIFQERDVGCLVTGHHEMAACVLHLLADRRDRERRAAAGRRLVEERWTWDGVAARYARLLDRVCAARAAASSA